MTAHDEQPALNLHDFVPSLRPEVCAECTWHRDDPSQHPQPASAGEGDPGPFLAPFRQLIHNVHRFGEHWSWRCGVGYSKLDPGYVDGACRYDHVVESWEQLATDATEHLRRWHDIHLPRPREISAGVAEAEQVVRERVTAGDKIGQAAKRVMAEYDLRGAAEATRSAEVAALRRKLERVLAANDQHYAELERLRAIEQRARDVLMGPNLHAAVVAERILGKA